MIEQYSTGMRTHAIGLRSQNAATENTTVRVWPTGTRVLKEHQKAIWSHVRSAWRIAQFCRGMHLNEEMAFNEILQREREEKADEAEAAAIRRERDRMRQRNSRLCRKYGLKSRRDRK